MTKANVNVAMTLGIGLVLVYLVYEAKKAFSSGVVQAAGDTAYNAATGSLTTAQANALIAQEQQQLIQAGMAPDAALKQATSDVNAALSTSSTSYWGEVGHLLDPFNW